METFEISLLYNILDPSGRGFVSEKEAAVLMKSASGISEMTPEEVLATLKSIDSDCSGKLAADDVLAITERKISERSMSENAWCSFSTVCGNRGKVELSDFTRIQVEQALSQDECHAIKRRATAAFVDGRLYDNWKAMIM